MGGVQTWTPFVKTAFAPKNVTRDVQPAQPQRKLVLISSGLSTTRHFPIKGVKPVFGGVPHVFHLNFGKQKRRKARLWPCGCFGLGSETSPGLRLRPPPLRTRRQARLRRVSGAEGEAGGLEPLGGLGGVGLRALQRGLGVQGRPRAEVGLQGGGQHQPQALRQRLNSEAQPVAGVEIWRWLKTVAVSVFVYFCWGKVVFLLGGVRVGWWVVCCLGGCFLVGAFAADTTIFKWLCKHQ